MNLRSLATAAIAAVLVLDPVTVRTQVTGVSVSPPAPVAGQPAQITITAQPPCEKVLVDFGDGIAPLHSPPSFPFTTQHTWMSAGSRIITAIGYGSCHGRASVTVKVTAPDAVLSLCARVDCRARPKMVFKPTIGALFGFNTPGGYLAIAGKNFGSQRGKVVATLRSWSGGTIDKRLETVEWTDTMVGVQWPYITDVRQQTASIVLSTAAGVASSPRSLTFSPLLEVKALPMADVKTVHCSRDSNHDSCNGTLYDVGPGVLFASIPAELAAGASILGAHVNRWGDIGNDTGTDTYEIALRRDWTLDSFHWRVGAEAGQAAARKPTGFTKGPNWSPSVYWEVTPDDQIVYAAVILIAGPAGVPYK